MKVNKIERSGRHGLIAVITLVGIVAILGGLYLGYDKLHEIWTEQCEIRDMTRQVTISSGKMVRAEVIAESFGLRVGANLALIDFAARREELLKKIPNIRTISVSRKLPDRVAIVAEERTPIARMGIHGQTGETGRVVDGEGVVFNCRRGTAILPVIREPAAPGTAPGRRLTGRLNAALTLVDTCRDPAYQDFNVLEIDTARTDFLVVTLGDRYSTVHLAWEGMDEAKTPENHANLIRQLDHLKQAMACYTGAGATTWEAYDTSKPGYIHANSKDKIQ